MKTWSPFVSPLVPVSLAGLLLFGTAPIAGCAAGSSDSVAAASDAPFEVTVSELAVTVVNATSRPLTEIRVTIVPAGALRFTSTAPRIEARGRRAFGMRDFRAHDSSPLDLRIVRPRSVQVIALDADGKEHQVQVPWKR